MIARPTVTVAIPTLNEAESIEACLSAVAAQGYDRIVEVLVVDGGSTDATRALVSGRPGVRVIDNPRRIQAAALNIALAEAVGEVFVRVDGHCRIAPDYVERCVETLALTGAAMVGGAMTPEAGRGFRGGIAAAMSSGLGAGPARFHTGGPSGRVDTVYLGAFRTDMARQIGGYAEDMVANEDAEFAHRMAERGAIWFEPSIRSTYTPRRTFTGVARQFFRYGRSRATTVRRHPRSLALRQLAAPLLVLGLLSRQRRLVGVTYLGVVTVSSAIQGGRDPQVGAGMAVVMPIMHLSWGTGFLLGLLKGRRGVG